MMSVAEDKLGLLLKALAFAAHKHKDQRRKDPDASPYINHPIALANVLCNEAHITDIDVICGALLHDTVEDTDTTEAELGAAFGPVIRAIVTELTDDKSLPKQERKRLQIANAADATEKARLVKLADKICNLRDLVHTPPSNWSVERRQQYFDWAKAVVDQIRGTHAALERAFDEAYRQRPQ